MKSEHTQLPAKVKIARAKLLARKRRQAAVNGRGRSDNHLLSQRAGRFDGDPRAPDLGSPALPDWVEELRPQQIDAVNEILEMYASGRDVVFFQGPTGTGKTLIAEVTRRLIGDKAVYVCSTKPLQDQFLKDFPYARVVKGRRNYPVGESGGLFVDGHGWAKDHAYTADDCTKTPGEDDCTFCQPWFTCPYQVARKKAMSADVAVLNSAYALAEWNLAQGVFAGRKLAIEDEGDLLEDQILSHVTVSISNRRRKNLGIELPQYKTKQDSWAEWVRDEALPKTKTALQRFDYMGELSVKDHRQMKGLQKLKESLGMLGRELEFGEWVYDHDERDGVTFRPVVVNRWGSMLIWPHAEKHLVMSGTILSADEMVDSLGIGEEVSWGAVDIPMLFPAENRQINYVPVAANSWKNQKAAYPKISQATANVARLHPGDRILVHSVNYRLTKVLVDELKSAGLERLIVTYQHAAGRQNALKTYLETERAVLVAPSMDRGVDLPADACRVQVITKVPYASLGDQQVKARVYGTKNGDRWYQLNTLRTLIQMTGRGVRSMDDWCVTYVLDSEFARFWRKCANGYAPDWWKEAVEWSFPRSKICP